MFKGLHCYKGRYLHTVIISHVTDSQGRDLAFIVFKNTIIENFDDEGDDDLDAVLIL
jgi:hypothetical protein